MDSRITKCKDVAGTPGYIPPEGLKGELSYEYDYFALGVVIYELLLYKLPFNAYTKEEMVEEFKSKRIELVPGNIPNGFNKEELCDFINRLLCLNRSERLGSKGIDEIKYHPYMKDYDWESVKCEKMSSLFVGSVKRNIDNIGNYDKGNECKSKSKSKSKCKQQVMLDVNVLNDKEFQKQFKNYDCVVKDIKKDNYKQLLLMKDVISLTEKYLIKKRLSNSKQTFKSTSPTINRVNNSNSNKSKLIPLQTNNVKRILRNDLSTDKVISKECKRIQLPYAVNRKGVNDNKQGKYLKKCSSEMNCKKKEKCGLNGNNKKDSDNVLPKIKMKLSPMIMNCNKYNGVLTDLNRSYVIRAKSPGVGNNKERQIKRNELKMNMKMIKGNTQNIYNGNSKNKIKKKLNILFKEDNI